MQLLPLFPSPYLLTLLILLHDFIPLISEPLDFDVQLLDIPVQLVNQLVLLSHLLAGHPSHLLTGHPGRVSSLCNWGLPPRRLEGVVVLAIRDVEVLVEHGHLGGVDGFSMRGDRLEAGDQLSAVELGDLREEEPKCLLVVLEVAHRIRPVLRTLEYELPQVCVALQVFDLVQLP